MGACALAACAAERYRLQHGSWPASLKELVDHGWMKAVPLDPFGGDAEVLKAAARFVATRTA